MPCKSQKKDCPCNRCRLGWHSRRHETREEQDAARERYQVEHGQQARQRKAEARLAAFSRTVVEQDRRVA